MVSITYLVAPACYAGDDVELAIELKFAIVPADPNLPWRTQPQGVAGGEEPNWPSDDLRREIRESVRVLVNSLGYRVATDGRGPRGRALQLKIMLAAVEVLTPEPGRITEKGGFIEISHPRVFYGPHGEAWSAKISTYPGARMRGEVKSSHLSAVAHGEHADDVAIPGYIRTRLEAERVEWLRHAENAPFAAAVRNSDLAEAIVEALARAGKRDRNQLLISLAAADPPTKRITWCGLARAGATDELGSTIQNGHLDADTLGSYLSSRGDDGVKLILRGIVADDPVIRSIYVRVAQSFSLTPRVATDGTTSEPKLAEARVRRLVNAVANRLDDDSRAVRAETVQFLSAVRSRTTRDRIQRAAKSETDPELRTAEEKLVAELESGE